MQPIRPHHLLTILCTAICTSLFIIFDAPIAGFGGILGAIVGLASGRYLSKHITTNTNKNLPQLLAGALGGALFFIIIAQLFVEIVYQHAVPGFELGLKHLIAGADIGALAGIFVAINPRTAALGAIRGARAGLVYGSLIGISMALILAGAGQPAPGSNKLFFAILSLTTWPITCALLGLLVGLFDSLTQQPSEK
jgi:hypothetical protein